jgi:cyclopropane fatty-acyl-phospholipid synthase-like methyltransferase
MVEPGFGPATGRAALRMVEDGYDAIGERYQERSGRGELRRLQVERLLERLVPGSDVLEMGCGSGEPVTRLLSAAHHVVAVDLSGAQLRLAARNAPRATLLQSSMLDLAFEPGSFDAVVAVYSVDHVPREHHADLIARVAAWLRPGGFFLASLGAGDEPGSVEEGWLGEPMFFSHFDPPTNRALVQRAGLEVLQLEVFDEPGEGVLAGRVQWIMARRRQTQGPPAPVARP